VSKLRYEPSDGFECERGHKLMKVFEEGQKYVHMLLCPRCDQDVIVKMEKEQEPNGKS
jgi:hypothetical protein